ACGAVMPERHEPVFWPRPGPRTQPPDLGIDRYCPICNYNLRGLPSNCGCPECGAIEGRTTLEPIPWDQDASLGSYLATVWMILTAPADFAAHAWSVES